MILETINGFCNFSLNGQAGAKIIVGDVIIFCHRERVAEKRFVVPPITQLVSCPQRTGNQMITAKKMSHDFDPRRLVPIACAPQAIIMNTPISGR